MIKLLKAKDSHEYKKLRLESLQKDSYAFLSKFELEKQESEHYFLTRILYSTNPPIYGYYGKYIDNKLVGYLQLASSSLPKKQHTAYLYELYVNRGFRKKGIATELINYIIEKVRSVPELEIIELYVNSGNLMSINLYKKLGFTQVASIPNAVKESKNTYQDELVFIFKL